MILVLGLLTTIAQAAGAYPLTSKSFPGTPLKSQAFTFRLDGVNYALASDQAVYNSPDTTLLVGETRAKLLAHDPRAGLALLELPADFSAEAFPTIGEAANREELNVADRTVKVAQNRSRRHHYEGLSYAVELSGGKSGPEFSLAGTPVWRKNGELAGFIGRYYLMYRPGLSTLVRRWSRKAKTENYGYVMLPAKYALEWAKRARSKAPSPWQVNLEAQVSDRYWLNGPGLQIQEEGELKDAELQSDGPIGGIDGFGIGGIATAFTTHKLTFSPSAGDPSHLPLPLRALAQRLKEPQILSLAYRGEKDPFGFTPVPIFDLDALLDESKTDLAYFTSRGSQKSPKEEALHAWTTAFEADQGESWSWNWPYFKAYPRSLQALSRCLFYLAWLKSDEWPSFPADLWRREADPRWGEDAPDPLAVRYVLRNQETKPFEDWEKAWR